MIQPPITAVRKRTIPVRKRTVRWGFQEKIKVALRLSPKELQLKTTLS